MLPVIAAYKWGNVLLDTGAQISLIRQETAESLGLEGKNISITITKVGGEEEMKTKAFKVHVTSLDNDRKFLIKAIGIPTISDDIVPIKTKEIGGHLGLTKEKLHRGRGPVDLLIGIDNAHMHTG